jgi:serine protease
LVTVGLLAVCFPAAEASGASPTTTTTGNLLVLLDRDRAAAASGRLAVQAGALPAGKSVPQIGLITIRPALGVSLAALERRLRLLPGVASVAPERRYVPRSIPNDPALTAPSSYSGVVQWTLAREGFYNAWDITRGDGALIGVVDSGVDASHPDLRAKIAAAVDQQPPADASGTSRTDEVGHGTHVASLACADTNNGIGMAGAGYDCKLVVEKSDFTDSSIAASIVDATDRGVQAINISFGPSSTSAAPAPDSEVRALDYAAAHKVVLVGAAADSPVTEQGDPANVLQPSGTGPDLGAGIGLDVTAADFTGNRASFAGYGSEISIAAYAAFEPQQPGVLGLGTPPGIFGAFPANATDFESLPEPCGCRTALQGSNSYAYLQGTSMAAPQVAATAAMMRVLNPYASLADILRILKQTAQRPAGGGWSADLGWGILNAGAALDATRHLDRLAPIAQLFAPRVSRSRVFTLRWRGYDQHSPGLIASGIAYYLIYVKDGKQRERLLTRTGGQRLKFRGSPGHRYSFRAIAVDHAGNRQAQPAQAITRVKLRRR